MKKLAYALLILALVAGGAMYWLAGNLDHLVKQAITHYGSAMTQARISVDAVKIAPVDGKGTISNLVIGNPPGFTTPYALKVGEIAVDIDVTSLTREVIVIRRITVNAPDVIYEKGSAMTNFDAIQHNIARYLGSSKNKSSGAGKKLIVEKLTIRNIKAQASAAFMGGRTVAVSLPDISMKNVGKAKGGISPGELGLEVANALEAKLTGAVNFNRLMQSTGETLNKASSAISGLFK